MLPYDVIVTRRDSVNDDHFIGVLLAGTTILGPRIRGKHRLPTFISYI